MPDLGDAFTRMPPEQQHKKGVEALKRANGRGTQQDDLARQLLMLMQMQESMGISDAVPRTQELPVNYQPASQPTFTPAPPASHLLPELPSSYQPPERWKYGSPVRMG